MKIIFPHIPKCAGTSIKVQLMEREDVYLDYFNHPTWAHKPFKDDGRKQQNALKDKIRELDSWIIFGHFSPATYYDLSYELQVIMLRDPLDRAISHFNFFKKILPDNETTRLRHQEVGPIKEDRMCIEEFAELDHIRYFYSNYYLKDLSVDERLIAVPIEDMESSCRKIMEASNLKLDYTVCTNKWNYSKQKYEHLRKLFHVDEDLYDYLVYHHVNSIKKIYRCSLKKKIRRFKQYILKKQYH